VGVIQKQSARQSIVGFVATAVGAISILLIYPLDITTYGTAIFIVTTAYFLFPFFSMGITNLTIKYFPQFEDKETNHNGLLPFLLISATACFLIFTLIAYLFYDDLLGMLESMHFESAKIRFYSSYIWVLSFFVIISTILTSYISNFNKIVVPHMINNLMPKILLPTLFYLFTLEYYSLKELLTGIVVYHAIMTLSLAIYLKYLGHFSLRANWSYLNVPLMRSMGVYALFGLLSAAGSVMAFRIDIIMITALVGATGAGSYSILQFMANTIEIPTRSVFSIASPIISSSVKENNWDKIASLYKKSSINLLSVGIPLFLCLWLSIDDVIKLTPSYEELRPWVYIVLFIGLGKLTHMLFSVNNHIILFSNYYYVNLIGMLVLAVVNIILNFILIPEYGILGAALATLIAVILHSLLKCLFILIKFKIHPFSAKTIYLLALATGVYFAGYLIPSIDSAILSIAIRSIVMVSLYLLILIRFNIAPEIVETILKSYNKYFRKKQ
jgi:O-antigen/teichoic acid export membrane protein